MFNPHIHQQQQQQQQQLHQHLRQLQQLFQQQPPPPPPPQPPPAHHVGHHHQTPRAIPVSAQTAPPPRMVNLCQTTQTTLIAPNPMLQSAILMQQMQGNMRGFGMGGQQFRQFFTAGARSSLLGPVPMGMAIKSPIMGFPAARPFHPHTRFFNATASSSSSISTTQDAPARQADRKRDSEQMSAGSTDNPPTAAANSANEATDEAATDGAVGGENSQTSEEQLEEPVTKRQKTEESEEPKEQHVAESVTTAQSESSSNTVDTPSEDCVSQEDECFSRGPDDVVIEENKTDDACGGLSAPSPPAGPTEDTEQVMEPTEEATQDKDASLGFSDSRDEEEASEGSNKFYCYLCSITCFNQQNFRSHMNSISHQQRMMEIQHMSNACLVTLLPRVQESLQGASKDGERKADPKQWCATCHTHFTSSILDHQRSEEHKLASKTDLSFCAVCQKRFKTSQNFVEHLHSQEHKQKIKEKGCETLAKLTNMGTDGFSCELEAQELEKNEGDQGSSKGGWPSAKEVALNDMTSDEQYDPDTIYGTSFLDPVAGFLCRLCNKFYLFESSALHSHCKSMQHFENLKSYKAMVGEKGDDAQASTKSIAAADGLRPVTEASDCSQENLLTTDTSEADGLNSTKLISLTELRTQEEDRLKEKESEAASISLDFNQQQLDEESPVALAAASRKEADSVPTAAAGDSNGEEEEEEEAPAGPGKKNCGGKGRSVGKRRSGRAANRR
ncbi:cdkn1a interacting zinc finger protein 1a isoform X1 [Gambusia affinis]|uniref:cdkn1a interacting zinc finger protein 1a isoform X1 n=1 Tax=Gambusia affinis TaxID=33528 RepID=UPI001CDD3017|nr:cdkn1a interacting zinc finger protein 1a isoform X1 [Gambusia affinis]XP_044000628.1 cdkn1a interacting zinc finger protein 1a isoform X1 [Gambusia affinis]